MDPDVLREDLRKMQRISQMLLLEDFYRIELQKRAGGSQYAAIIGKENSQHARGMIYAFLDPDEIQHYMPTSKVIRGQGGEFLSLAESDFFQQLSEHLRQDSDRARCIARRDDGQSYLYCDSNIVGVWERARPQLEALLGDITTVDHDALEFWYGDEGRARKIDLDSVYLRLFADAYHGHEAMRTGTALYLAMATQRPTIITRQRVVEQESFDLSVVNASGVSEVRSRLGTGEILQIGPQGLEMKTVLRVAHPDAANQEFAITYVEQWDPALQGRPHDGSVVHLPVVMEVRTYENVNGTVRPRSERPVYVPASMIPLRPPQGL